MDLIDRRHINEYLGGKLTKQNCFIFVKLLSEKNETIATNFLLLDSIKNTRNIVDAKLMASKNKNISYERT